MKSFSKIAAVALLLSATFTTGCTRVETGNVGVQTSFTKQVSTAEVNPGIHMTIFSDIEQHSVKEIPVVLNDMRPQTKDNLNLRELDVEVYYTVAPAMVAELMIKYAGRTVWADTGDTWYTCYSLVESVARGAAYSVVQTMDSLVAASKRDEIEAIIKRDTQAELDSTDPGAFKISRVVVRNVQVDPSIQDAIKITVAKDKELEAMRKEKEIKTEMAAANANLQKSLTPEILRYKELENMAMAIKDGKDVKFTVLVGSEKAVPVYNLP